MLKKSILLAAAAMLWSNTASAATVLDEPASTGAQATPGSLIYTFNAGAGAGMLDFILEGYLSLDGAGNCCTDVFNVSLNGMSLLNGAYDLGGGGMNTTNFIVPGGSISPMSNGFFAGGSAPGSLPITLLSGLNTLTFTYSGGSQGLGDEGWGLNSLQVTGEPFGAVPEPATWALMMLGFGAIGGGMRARRRKQTTTVSYA